MENYQKQYPHISPEMAQTLQEIAASREQWQSSDAAAKSQIDATLAGYHLGPGNMTFMVIGTSGAGKSATANTLLGKKVFKEGGSAVTMTTTSQVEKTNVDGIQLTVVDTPWVWNTQIQTKSDMSLADIFYIVVVNMASPRFGQAELDHLKTLKGHDGKSVLTPGRCLVVLTHADSALQQSSLEQYIKEIKGDPLHELLTEHVKGNVLAINNSPTTEYEQSCHQQAMLMNTMVAMNGQMTTPPGFFMLIYLLFMTIITFLPCALAHAALYIPKWMLMRATWIKGELVSRLKSLVWPNKVKTIKKGWHQ